MEGSQEIISHRKIGQHAAGGVLNLMVLQEKPLENYFEGTKKGKKIRRRKRNHHRNVIPPSELFSDGAQTSNGEVKQPKKALTEEEKKTEIQLLDLRIYEYEKMREQRLKKDYMRQKMAEQDYICQLENLVAKWFQTEKRRNGTKNVFPKSFPEETSKKSSLTSKEFCNEHPVSPPGKSKKVFKDQAEVTDSVLGDEFYEKLVFVDEDSDEFDYEGQSLQFGRSLGKH